MLSPQRARVWVTRPKFARGFLDAVDHGVLAQLVVGLRGEGAAGTGGHVIHDDGGMYPVGDVGVVLDETGLGGLIIIRSDDEQAVDAAGLCVQGQIQGGHGAVAAGAGDDLDPVIHLLDAYSMAALSPRWSGWRLRRWCLQMVMALVPPAI